MRYWHPTRSSPCFVLTFIYLSHRPHPHESHAANHHHEGQHHEHSHDAPKIHDHHHSGQNKHENPHGQYKGGKRDEIIDIIARAVSAGYVCDTMASGQSLLTRRLSSMSVQGVQRTATTIAQSFQWCASFLSGCRRPYFHQHCAPAGRTPCEPPIRERESCASSRGDSCHTSAVP